jgi:hypothetical protein
MTDSQKDIWTQWLLHRRFGGDPQRMKMVMERLYAVRDKVEKFTNHLRPLVESKQGVGRSAVAYLWAVK